MRVALRLLLLLPAVLLLPLTAASQVEPVGVDVAQLRAKLLAGPHVEGKLTEVRLNDDEEGQLTVEYTHLIKRQVDPLAVQRAEILKKVYEKVLESKFEPAIEKVGEELAKAQEAASDTVRVPIPFVLLIDKSVKLRTQVVPLDDNGKPRKFTPEELKKVKGDPSLPGYVATRRDLEAGNPVRFILNRAKARPAPAKSNQGKAAGPEKTIYPISMLIVLQPKIVPGANPLLPK